MNSAINFAYITLENKKNIKTKVSIMRDIVSLLGRFIKQNQIIFHKKSYTLSPTKSYSNVSITLTSTKSPGFNALLLLTNIVPSTSGASA